ncbi:MAG: undecaprenyl-diphosphate phosphatase [Deltaproteobacteria bacterium]|nr:undecaprenyl-diphosphate phosphatase [Deltaproteobacteria bacterium]
MEPIHAIILGIIQGLTEFLPVSSSGHLVIFQNIFGLKEGALAFDINVHVGTLLVVLICFRKEILSIIISIFRSLNQLTGEKKSISEIYKDPDFKLAFLIVAGSVPTGILGLMFHSLADSLFSSVAMVGLMLICTGFILWFTRYLQKTGRDIDGFVVKDSLIIGLIQGLAIIPGISRSGSTIAAGLYLGLNRETAARYSFLLSVPAIIGAEILNIKNLPAGSLIPDNITLLGMLASFITGYSALKVLLFIVKKGNMHFFAPYCWIAGIAALVF